MLDNLRAWCSHFHLVGLYGLSAMSSTLDDCRADHVGVMRDVNRLAAELGAAIRRQGFTFEEVERRLQWRRGHIRRELDARGGRDLHFDQVFEILAVIGLDPPALFSKVWPR